MHIFSHTNNKTDQQNEVLYYAFVAQPLTRNEKPTAAQRKLKIHKRWEKPYRQLETLNIGKIVQGTSATEGFKWTMSSAGSLILLASGRLNTKASGGDSYSVTRVTAPGG